MTPQIGRCRRNPTGRFWLRLMRRGSDSLGLFSRGQFITHTTSLPGTQILCRIFRSEFCGPDFAAIVNLTFRVSF